jgi:hypothetical protein
MLVDVLGARLERAGRAFFRHRGETDEGRGALELEFDGGRVLHLTTATNAMSLDVRSGPWVDPLADEDGSVDEAWVREHGGYVRVDVSARPGYAECVGRPLEGVRWLADEHGAVAGVEMRFGAAMLTFVSWGDDEYAFAGGASEVPEEWKMRLVSSLLMPAC